MIRTIRSLVKIGVKKNEKALDDYTNKAVIETVLIILNCGLADLCSTNNKTQLNCMKIGSQIKQPNIFVVKSLRMKWC